MKNLVKDKKRAKDLAGGKRLAWGTATGKPFTSKTDQIWFDK